MTDINHTTLKFLDFIKTITYTQFIFFLANLFTDMEEMTLLVNQEFSWPLLSALFPSNSIHYKFVLLESQSLIIR